MLLNIFQCTELSHSKESSDSKRSKLPTLRNSILEECSVWGGGVGGGVGGGELSKLWGLETARKPGCGSGSAVQQGRRQGVRG